MKITLISTIIALSASTCGAAVNPFDNVRLYERWQREFRGPEDGNPYANVTFGAKFINGSDTLDVPGFYDGSGIYVIRFLPLKEGRWDYTTTSSAPQLDGIAGYITCSGEAKGHGPVQVSGRHTFAYADSTRYMPFGTTAYAWAHMTPDLQRITLSTLAGSDYNKIRMCVMPKSYALCKKEPIYYPFASGPSATEDMTLTARSGKQFDMTRFNPSFFRNFEQAIDSLAELGIEADLILFHPYDKGEWGFDSMPAEVNEAYARYLVARFASFPNVWWSMANEYDYVKSKTEDDWLNLIDVVDSADPYGHLLSIHGSTATYFPYESTPRITHTSIQDEAPVMEPGRAAILRSVYRKPVVLDEVCYEGNLPNRWGRLSGQEMIHRIWNGVLGGTYVTHGECFLQHPTDNDTIMWAEGGRQRGESWKRIGFIRDIVESMPAPVEPADITRDIRTSTGGQGHYLIYFGKEMPESWLFNLPAKCAGYDKLKPGTRFKVEIIDTWDMTVTEWPETMEIGKAVDYRHYDINNRNIRLPLTPYVLLRVTEIND
ncbi:MAG: DUF4038 domain-containing protein [Duncaniella sp.]|nr:DUF4038 domain-containing protein [Duncaniella sp.]